jgi:antitoxin component of RelBE/YafQ-DinJ toxin-antitoxin module
MNITLSVDQRLVERARKAAEAMGKSLNQVIRDYLAYLAGEGEMEAELSELHKLSMASGGRSGGRRIERDSLHART